MTERRVAELPGGPVEYTLRRSPRSRRLRVTIDPHRGVLVTVPTGGRGRWADPEADIEAFLVERESWLRRHLDRRAHELAVLAARGPLGPDAIVRYRGALHRVVVESLASGRRSSVERVGAGEGDELHVRLAPGDRRPLARVLRDWLRAQARRAIERSVTAHAGPLGVSPAGLTVRDQRTRWGSASRTGRLAFSWRLVLAPPEALETVVVHELAHLRVFGHGPRFWDVVATRVPDHARWRRWLRDHSTELHAAFEEVGP